MESFAEELCALDPDRFVFHKSKFDTVLDF